MTLTFRNSRGELMDVPAIPATRAKNEFGTVLEQAVVNGAVAITRHDRPKAVLVSYAEFSSLVNARTHNLDDLGAEFDDLLARMQTPAARKGVDAAFRASPAQLGRAAVAAAVPARGAVPVPVRAAVGPRGAALPRRAAARTRARRPKR